MTEVKKHFCVKCGKETTTFFKISKVGAELWANVNSYYTFNPSTFTVTTSSSNTGTVNGTVWSNASSGQWISSISSSASYPLNSVVGSMTDGDDIIIELCTDCMKDIIADILVVQNL
jgi:hypothetical protein